MDADLVVDADDLAPAGQVDPHVQVMLEEPAPYPTDALPAVLANLLRAYCDSTGLEYAPVALSLLSACTGAVGNGLRMHVGGEWFEACAIWGVVIAGSGSMKSTLMALPIRLLQAVEAQERDPDAEDGSQPEVLMTGHTTTEAAAVWQQRNKRGGALMRDEFTGFLAGLDAYRNARGMDRTYFLEAYDGRPFSLLRKQSGSVRIDHHLLTLFGCAQPGILAAAFTAADVQSGLVPRFNFTTLGRKAWERPRAPADAERTLRDAERRLVDLLLAVRSLPLRDGVHPHDVRASVGAARVLEEYGEAQSRRAHVLPDGAEAAMLNKSRGVAARLALTFAALDRAAAGMRAEDVVMLVSEEHAERAVCVAGWMAEENLRAYRLLGKHDAGDGRRRALELAAEAFKRGGGRPFTSRDFQRLHHVNAKQAEALLNQCKPAWTCMQAPTGEKGGRPSMQWHPAGWRKGD